MAFLGRRQGGLQAGAGILSADPSPMRRVDLEKPRQETGRFFVGQITGEARSKRLGLRFMEAIVAAPDPAMTLSAILSLRYALGRPHRGLNTNGGPSS